MMQESGLRERKKQRTRQDIVDAALKLFQERGFDATTVADIAAAADIAPRTFFGYFPSKEEVVFHDFEEIFETFAQRLREREAGETAFDVLRSWIVGHLADREGREAEDRFRKDLIHATPALAAHERANMGRFYDLLAEGVATDLGVAPDALRPRLVAAAAVAALEALEDTYAGADEPPRGDAATAILDEALVFLQGGMDALRRHPAA